MGRIRLNSYEDTLLFGERLAAELPRSVLALSGDLGSGKTSFVQGLARGLGIKERVQSPTFVLLNIYPGLYHFDLYRLKNSEDFMGLGFHEYFEKEGICAIEWPDRIQDILPAKTIYIHFAYDESGRIVEVR